MPLKTFRYAACGGGNLVLDLILYFIVFNFVINQENLELGFVVLSPHIASLFIVFPITFLTGFALNKYITFEESNLKGKIQIVRYFIVSMGAIIISYLLMKLFVDLIGLPAFPSRILTTVISVVYSYILQNKFTFTVK
ncbi:MAG: GtrA family protein [Flavobacteriales bacterium]|jgi:putative flippase GtrA|nr:GtrA family protein [Flavobacteriales bacterium]